MDPDFDCRLKDVSALMDSIENKKLFQANRYNYFSFLWSSIKCSANRGIVLDLFFYMYLVTCELMQQAALSLLKSCFLWKSEDRTTSTFKLAIRKSVTTESSVVTLKISDFGASMSIPPPLTFNNPTKSLPINNHMLLGTQAPSGKTSEEIFIEASDIIDYICSLYYIPSH